MDWPIVLLLILGSFLLLMMLGMPVAFAFLLINVIGVWIFWGGGSGLEQMVLSIRDTLASFALLPVPLFILMGEVMFRSQIATRMIDAVDKWMGRIPGRLGLVAVGGGTLFATLSGASMASTAVLGSILTPDMEERGYKKPMSLGPILGSAGLSIMIPPSALAVLMGAIGVLSVGKILIAIIPAGLIMAVLYAAYIILRCKVNPAIAPSYEVPKVPLSEKLSSTARHILPLGIIVFLVVGVIFLGIASPSEAAATGALGCFGLAAAYRRLNWQIVKESVVGTIHVSVMVFMIIAAARSFANILAFSGATKGLVEMTTVLPLAPVLIVVAMMIIVVFLGMFMNEVAMMLICLPVFLPVIKSFGYNPTWFAVIFLLNIEMATTSPPYGLNLFVMKGVASPDTTMGDIYKAALPFLGCDVIAMALIIAFPAIVEVPLGLTG